MELREQADEIFDYITVKNGPYVFDLDSESESDSADDVDVLDSDDDTLVTTPAGSLGSSGSYGTLGTPPSEPKDTELGSNPYLTPSSGQSERLASEVSDSGDSGPSGTIIVQTAPAGTTDTPNSSSSASESVPEQAQ